MKNLLLGLLTAFITFAPALKGEEMTEEKPLLVIMMGPPGAGKGTQAVRLAKQFDLPHISTGDLFRKNLKEGTPLGLQVKGILDAGDLVPDDIVVDMLFDRIAQKDCHKGFLLDGFPRTIPQAEVLSSKTDGKFNVVVLDLRVADSEIVKRITGRLMCKECGNIQHKSYSPPAKEGLCDACGGELYQRSDDTEEVVKNRLDAYHKQTTPLIGYYDKQSILYSVQGESAPEEVFQNLCNKLETAKI